MSLGKGRRSRIKNLFAAAVLMSPVAAVTYAQGSSTRELKGTRWQLVRFHDKGGRTVSLHDPGKYSLEFADLLVTRLDCNIGRSTWTTSGSELHVGELARTRHVCQSGSMSEQLAQDWADIRSYDISNGTLVLTLLGGHRRYEFERKDMTTGGLENVEQMPQRGSADCLPSSSVKVDTKGTDFGGWIEVFRHEVEKNWLVPGTAKFLRGHSIVTFVVYRDGQIPNVGICDSTGIGAFDYAALTAVWMSGPTRALPLAYPDDKAHFTVTFFYNEKPPDTPAAVSPQ